MEVIFLDVDGVVCLHEKKNDWDDDEIFDQDCCRRLKEIMQETGCKLVLSSSWRLFPESVRYALKQFRECGIEREDFIGKTPLLDERGQEIMAYLKKHPEIHSFVALDDEMFDCDAFPYDRLVLTETNRGITELIKDVCIEKLNG